MPPFGGAIVGYNRLDGAWAVRASDGEVIDQPKPKGYHGNFVGWQDDSHYMIFDSDDTCYSVNLRNVNVVDGKTNACDGLRVFIIRLPNPPKIWLCFSPAMKAVRAPREREFFSCRPGNRSHPVDQ